MSSTNSKRVAEGTGCMISKKQKGLTGSGRETNYQQNESLKESSLILFSETPATSSAERGSIEPLGNVAGRDYIGEDSNVELKTLMLDHFRSIQRTQNKMLLELETMKMTLDRNGILMNGSHTPLTISNGSNKNKYEEIMWSFVPGFNDIYGIDMLRMVCAASMFKLMQESYDQRNEVQVVDIHTYGRNVLSVLLFAVKPDGCKSEIQVGDGPKFSRFRKILVQSCVYHSQNDTLNMFEETNETGSGHEVDKKHGVVCSSHQTRSARSQNLENGKKLPIRRPEWLHPKRIMKADVEFAKERNEHMLTQRAAEEDRKLKKTIIRTKNPNGKQIARFITLKLYSTITKYLHDCRERIRTLFFEELGYVLINWDKLGISSELRRPIIVFPNDADKEDLNYFIRGSQEFENIADAVVISDRDEECEKKNKEIFEKLVACEKNLIFFVQYEVFMKDVNHKSKMRLITDKGALGKDKKVMRREVNLITVASHTMSAYNGYGASENVTCMFKCSKKSFRCIYYFAMFLKTVILESRGDIKFNLDVDNRTKVHHNEMNKSKEFADGEAYDNQSDGNHVSSKTVTENPGKEGFLSILEPGKSICNRIIDKFVLNVSQELYECNNIPIPGLDNEEDNNPENIKEGRDCITSHIGIDDDDIVTM